MNNSFKIFTVIIGLLVILVILRLNSITYPRDIEDDTAVVYLEEFHTGGGLFDIDYKGGKYMLRPLTPGINIKGLPADKTLEIGDGDLISLEGRRYQFNVFPRAFEYREVFRRTIRGLFLHGKDLRYLGGWPTTNRREILANNDNGALLKKLLVEIGAEELNHVLGPVRDFDGKLLALSYTPGILTVNSPHLPFTLVRGLEEQEVTANSPVVITDGNVLKLPYWDAAKTDEALFIKFNLPRVRGVDYLSISYKEKVSGFPSRNPGQGAAFLKSLDSGEIFPVDKTRKNAFIGDGGLYAFNLEPSRLLEKFFIPDKISEGGVTDIKELLDRRMYYRQDNRFYPVTREFLERLRDFSKDRKDKRDKKDTKDKKDNKDKKDKNDIRDYFTTNHIEWREFDSYEEFRDYLAEASALITKMENKGVFRMFREETAKLNSGHGLLGVGLNAGRSAIRLAAYKVPGRSWLEAAPIRDNTPIINGIDYFYWGNLVGDSDEPVEFKFTFNKPLSSLGLIAPADYAVAVDGKPYKTVNFFDGVQKLEFPGGITELSLKLWNLDTFNRNLGATNFQGKIVFSYPGDEVVEITTDGEWQGSIDDFHWSGVLVNPANCQPHPEAGRLNSIWYDEKWNPVYSGIRSRYFRRTFQLKTIPRAVEWKIFTPGHYLVRVNRRVVQTESDFLAALRKGENRVTVMVTRRGIRKHFYREMLFAVDGDRIVLKQGREQRAGARKTAESRKPFVLDIRGEPLAYNCEINGEQRRFYAPQAMTELLSIFGSPEQGSWGLEQVFSRLYDEGGIQGIRLTVNRAWQSIALEAMGKILQANKEEESKDPDFQKFAQELAGVETRLLQKRAELAGLADVAEVSEVSETSESSESSESSAVDTADRQKLMLEIIELQNRGDEIKGEINKIKNHFYEAAVVLMTPRGEIRAAASYPYNEETMKALNPHLAKPYRPGENPYVNRGWEWKYNPGSTAKILDSIAFLESKDRKDESGRYMFPYLRSLLGSEGSFGYFPRTDLKGSVMLNGKAIGFQLRNFQQHDVPPGFCTLKDAFAHSYNTYFSYLAMHNNRVMTLDSLVYDEASNSRYKWVFVSKGNIPVAKTYEEYPLLEFAERHLLNHKIDLLYNLRESSFASRLARMPNDGFMAVESRFPVNAYSSSNIAHYSIGQGDFQLTALQNAMIVSSVLNRGVLVHPSVISSITFNNQEKPFVSNPEKDKVRVYAEATADQVKEAMKEVVERGTAGGLFHDIREGRVFYAKTGTAETEVYRDNSLFVGFVEFQEGEPLIFSAIVPRSGQGARVAGKLTAQILSAIIAYENEKGKKL